jgi:hypothetical protein
MSKATTLAVMVLAHDGAVGDGGAGVGPGVGVGDGDGNGIGVGNGSTWQLAFSGQIGGSDEFDSCPALGAA